MELQSLNIPDSMSVFGGEKWTLLPQDTSSSAFMALCGCETRLPSFDIGAPLLARKNENYDYYVPLL